MNVVGDTTAVGARIVVVGGYNHDCREEPRSYLLF